MNERIKELAIRAGLDADLDLSLANQPLESFAELIVQECSQIAHNSHPDDLPFVGGKIKEHFGVE